MVGEPDPEVTVVYEHDERAEIHPFLPADARSFLDVGCSTGAVETALRRLYGSEALIVGLEPNEVTAQAARDGGRYDEVVVGTFPSPALEGRRFDCVLFNDVLEHMLDPWEALFRTHEVLASQRRVVASIPNIQYLPVVWDLVRRSRFEYTETGVLDRTHVRFFTWKSMMDMFVQAGFEVERMGGFNSAFAWPPWRRYRWLAPLTRNMRWMQYVLVGRPR